MPLFTLVKKAVASILFSSILFAACKKKDSLPPPPPASSEKTILSFTFKLSDNTASLIADITGTVAGDTIKVVVPAETDITALKPAIDFTGKLVSPANGVVQNFSSPVNYIVTANDGSTKKYVVAVNYRSTLYVVALGVGLYAFDAVTGQFMWRSSNTQFYSCTPAVYNGLVYINGYDGFYAIDARTGVQKWKYPIVSAGTGGAVFTPSPVVANNVAYVPAFDGYVYALNAADGSLKWKTRSTAGNPFTSSVTLNNNLLYAGCEDSSLYAFNIANGTIAWKFNAQRQVYVNPLVVNNNVCIESFAKNWYLLNGATGAVIWTAIGDDNMSSPTYDNGRIYAGGGNRAAALDVNSGAQVWSIFFTPGGFIYNERPSPVVSNGVFYAGSNDGNFYAYDIATKNRLWVYHTAEVNQAYIFSSPVLCDGRIYFGNNNGVEYALDAASGALLWKGGTSNGIDGSACVVDKNGVKHYPGVSGEQN